MAPHCAASRKTRRSEALEESDIANMWSSLMKRRVILRQRPSLSPRLRRFLLTRVCVDECYRLRWESVTWTNGRNGTILLTHGKTAAARRVLPLTVRAKNILQARWAAAGSPAGGWVWSAPTRSGHFEKSTIKKQHKKALRLSRVRPFVLYSLRHTFLTRLGESGCDTWTLARIAGHSSVAMSAR